jgi:hypothetical protein
MFMAQGGQYGHALQIILYPFTLVEWHTAKTIWVVINVLLSFLIPFLICRSFKIHTNKILLIILIFITCYPTRMTINYGQQSLFVLFFLILPFLKSKNYSYFLSGFSYVKYSTGYIIFLNYLVEKKFKNLIFATLPIFFGWIFYSTFTKSNPIQNFFDPFELILRKNYFQSADLYSLLNIYLFGTNNIFNKSFIILIVVLFTASTFTQASYLKLKVAGASNVFWETESTYLSKFPKDSIFVVTPHNLETTGVHPTSLNT